MEGQREIKGDYRDCGDGRYMQVQNCMERQRETKETVETGDTCRYKIVWRDRERLRRLKRLWRRGKYKIVWRDRD